MKLILATAAEFGLVYDAHRLAVERLGRLCRQVGLEYDLITLSDPLLARARNDLIHLFMTRCWDATDLVMLGPNILFEAPDLLEMVALHHDILGGVVPRMVFEWEHASNAGATGITAEAYVHPLVVETIEGETIDQDGTLKVKGLGLEAMKITRKALVTIGAKLDDYLSDSGPTSGERVKNYFAGGVSDSRLPSDARYFCAKAIEAGFELRAFVRSRGGHGVNFCQIGKHIFRGSVETRLGVEFK